ncbi:bifunctional ribonuclease/(p)ppGpp synthase [Rhodococcus aerolatus]
MSGEPTGPVRYVGVDLARGTAGPTGVAVLDADARLLAVGSARTDAEVLAAVAPHAGGPCVVALDAPIVAAGTTGRRPAEKALDRDLRRAGARPAATGRPQPEVFGRAARLCAELGLDTDPRSGRPRRGIEVHPHAAGVVLLDPPTTPGRGAGPGRTLDSQRDALLALLDRVERVVQVDTTGAGLRRAVVGATRKAELRVVAGQVDAVLCAYVALFADTRPAETAVYGDHATGAILTPALRPADDPDGPPRLRPRRQPDPVQAAVRTYTARRPGLELAGAGWVELVAELLDEAGINYLSVTGRTKTVASFAEKATRRRDGVLLFPDPLTDIIDQLGVRIITYVQSDVAAVADLLREEVVVTDDRDLGEQTAAEGRFGYASRHLLIGLDPARRGQARWSDVGDRLAQVQVRTVLQHAWAEFEHEARYKGHVPAEHAHDLDRRFTLAAGLLELADEQLSAIREKLRAAEPAEVGEDEPDDPRLDPGELAAFLAGQYADAGWSRADRYGWISGLLLELGITRFDELAEVLRSPVLVGLNERLGYRFPPGAVRRLDDALLAAHGERYVALTGNTHRAEQLRARLARMR